MCLFSNPENRPFKCLPSLNPKFQNFAYFHRGMSRNPETALDSASFLMNRMMRETGGAA
jgi:hypothetical protein